MSWIARRRKQIGMNQDELAAKLQVSGFDVARTTISHWENGKSNPPLDEPRFGRALANALRMSISDMLIEAGYDITLDTHSQAGRRAADIVDQLSTEKQDLALTILEQLLETKERAKV